MKSPSSDKARELSLWDEDEEAGSSGRTDVASVDIEGSWLETQSQKEVSGLVDMSMLSK